MPELWQAILVDAIVRPLSETSYRLRGDLIGVAPFFGRRAPGQPRAAPRRTMREDGNGGAMVASTRVAATGMIIRAALAPAPRRRPLLRARYRRSPNRHCQGPPAHRPGRTTPTTRRAGHP